MYFIFFVSINGINPAFGRYIIDAQFEPCRRLLHCLNVCVCCRRKHTLGRTFWSRNRRKHTLKPIFIHFGAEKHRKTHIGSYILEPKSKKTQIVFMQPFLWSDP